MSIPSTPNTGLLEGINWFSTQLKSGNDRINWFLKDADFKNMSKISPKEMKQLNELTQTLKLNEEFKKLKSGNREVQRMAEEAKKQIEAVKSTANNAKTATDNLKAGKWQNLGKGGTKIIRAFNFLTAIAAWMGAILGWQNTQAIKDLVDANQAVFDSINGEMNGNALRFGRLFQRVQKIEKDFEKRIKSIESDNRTLGMQVQAAFNNSVKGRELAEQGRKLSNDALYETRQGRKILEEKILNINASIKKQYDSIVNQLNNNTNNTIRQTINQLQKQVDQISANLKPKVQTPQPQVATKEDVQRLAVDIKKVSTIVNNLPVTIKNTFDTTQGTIKQVVDRAVAPLAKIADSWGVTVTPATITPATVTPSQDGALTVTPATVTPATVTLARFSSSAIGEQVSQQIKQEIAVPDGILLNSIASVQGQVNDLRGQVSGLRTTTTNLGRMDVVDTSARTQIKDLQQIQNQIKNENLQQTQQINQLNQQLQAEQRMNQEGIQKLNNLLTVVNTIGIGVIGVKTVVDAIPTNTINQLTPQIPPLVGQAICNSANGGCLGNSLNQTANNINNNTNAANNNLWDKINAGLNGLSLGADGAAMAVLNTIDNKLGDLIPNGGISGKLISGFKWLQLDRALNMLIFAASLHNAWMLSNNVVQTCTQILSNILATMGLKDEDGNPFNIGDIINSSVENFVKSVIGEENYKKTTEAMAKANRIYQASANVINAVQGLGSLVLNALEIVGSHVNLIGNALKAAGVVAEKAYKWFNPSPDFDNPWMARLEKLDNAANTVQMVTQIPVDIGNAITEVNNSTNELIKTVKGEEITTNQGIDAQIPDYKKLRQEQEKAKSQSQSPFISLFDIFKGS